MLQHHGREVGRRGGEAGAAAFAGERFQLLGHLVVAGGHDAVRRQALDGERAGDADLGRVHIGPVVEIFDVGAALDGLVDLALPIDAGLPPCGVVLLDGIRPRGIGLARDLPFLPRLAERLVETLAQRLERRLSGFPDRVDLLVVGDRLQCDVRRAIVDEALADVAVRWRVGLHLAGCFLFSCAAFGTVGEVVVWQARAHEPRAGEG